MYEYKDLNESSKKFAIANLKENPSQVNAHIESLRRWVTSMPHLTCPTDSNFLLRFLRVAKFDHRKAEKRLDNFCTVRSSPKGCPQFYQRNHLDEKSIGEFLDHKIFVPLGRLDNGDLVFLAKINNWDPDKLILKDFFTNLFLAYDVLMTDEESQIHGFHALGDMEGASKKVVESWGDPKLVKNIFTAIQDSFPIRLKSIIFYNQPAVFNILLSMILFFLNDKLKQRVFVIKDDLKKAQEKLPGFEKILPQEYGGQGEKLDIKFDKWKEKVQSYYKNGDELASISVDESKRPTETAKYLAEYKEYKGPTYGTDGSFTKYDNVF